MSQLDLVTAVAPYVTAIIAVASAAYTVWLNHRFWLKQFSIQKSEALLTERIQLLKEVLKTTGDVMALIVEAQFYLACSDAFASTKYTNAANGLMDVYQSNVAKATEILRGFETTEIVVATYFDEEAASRLEEFRNWMLRAAISPFKFTDVSAVIVQTVTSGRFDPNDIQAFIRDILPQLMPKIGPAFDKAHELRQAVIRTMAPQVMGTH